MTTQTKFRIVDELVMSRELITNQFSKDKSWDTYWKLRVEELNKLIEEIRKVRTK